MRFLIVGGGVAGMTAALSLVDDHGVDGSDIGLIEAGDRLGGCLRPTTLAGQRIDAGPDSLLTRRPEGVGLVRGLGLGGRTVAPASGQAYLGTADGLVPYPKGLFLGVPLQPASVTGTPALSPAGSQRALEGFELAPTSDRRDVTVRELVARRWGDEVADRLAGPLLAAVHAGRADYLSAEACAPQLFPDARPPVPAGPSDAPGPSPFISLDGGLWQLADELRAALQSRRVEIRTGAAADEMAPRRGGWAVSCGPDELEAERLILAVAAPVAARLLRMVAPDASAQLDSVQLAPVALAAVLLPPDTTFPEGSGFLVPATEGSDGLLTACTWFDQKWPSAARPDGRVVRLSTGRHGDRRFEDRDDDALAAELVAELARYVSGHLEVLASSVTRFTNAFPQYAVGHLRLAKEVLDDVHRATGGTVGLCGSSYRGVGLPAVIGSARDAAAAVSGRA